MVLRSPRTVTVVFALAVALGTISGAAAGVRPPATASMHAPTAVGHQPLPSVSTPPNATIENVTFTGDAVATTSDGRRVLWHQSSFELTVTFTQPNEVEAVCLWADRPPETRCDDFMLRENATTATFEVDSWPGDERGERNVTIEVRGEEQVLDRNTIEPLVLAKNESYDGDSLTNAREVEMNTSVLLSDTDDDGLRDGEELNTYDTDPTDPDTDDDGLLDGAEINQGTDPLDPDTDDDGLEDGREEELGTNPEERDTDSDGLEDGREVELGTDPAEKDTDGDGLNDGREVELGTDPTEVDTDSDGLNDGREVELGTDPAEKDTDGDGLNDGREVELGTDPTEKDTDGDALGDSTEVALGTDPASPLTPITLGMAVITVLVAGTTFVRHQRSSEKLQLQTSDGALLPWPYLVRGEADEESEGEEPADSMARMDTTPAREQPDPDVDPGSFGAGELDREKVLRLLQENNGRLRQGQIVEETDWSESKVSRVLSKMEDDKQISKLKIGRENIVTVYGEEPGNLPTENE